jgi:hypothetical protein
VLQETSLLTLPDAPPFTIDQALADELPTE